MANILLLGGDPVSSDIYQRKFVASGFGFDLAATGKDGLAKVSENGYDAVLFEVDLPNENGIEVLEKLRSVDDHLKVIVFSDSTDSATHKKALEMGVNGFIAKSDCSPSRLLSEVSRFLRQFEEQRKNAERFLNGGVAVAKNKKILLVEDEDVFADMFGRRLRDEGYEVDIAVNGLEGFAKASENKYDLIITDMIMPGLNGRELIDRLKDDERTKDMPIFLFSASVGDDVLDDMHCDVAKCFMKTHITPSELAREANDFLE